MKSYKFAGIHSGIKQKDLKDLGLIYSEEPASAAALFTRNKVAAAPVILGREIIKNGKLKAVLVNSGNANCFTGLGGIEDAETCARLTADNLGISSDMVFISSTGVIGAPLPMDRFYEGIPEVARCLDENRQTDFAEAILTTDTCAKIIEKKLIIDNEEIHFLGIAKGSGMIRPDMATMLAYILTDADISPSMLHSMLSKSNEKSFSRISVDGDTSTNDTLLALANGASGVEITGMEAMDSFQQCLDEVCFELARMVVKDGEGATKLITINVKGASSKKEAFSVCEAIAHSNLVKTAVYGEDPNWGRITAAAGRSGAQVDMDKMDLFFGEVPLVADGKWLGSEAEKKAAKVMKNEELSITLQLNLGEEDDFFMFCDFSEDYVKINADYRS